MAIATDIETSGIGNQDDATEPTRLFLLCFVVIRSLSRRSGMGLMKQEDVRDLMANVGTLAGEGVSIVVDDDATAIHERNHGRKGALLFPG